MVLDRPTAARHGKHLEYFTIAWNSLEGLIALTAGLVAGSISLVGFGVDSLIEVTSGAALLWRMFSDADEGKRERAEAVTLRLVGACFIALAVLVAFEGTRDLVSEKVAEHSLAGIILACVSLIVMPILSRAKRKVSKALRSAAMNADAKQTEFCTYLSAIMLAGLLLNALLGWWWADPTAALLMTPIIAKEGLDGLRGRACSE